MCLFFRLAILIALFILPAAAYGRIDVEVMADEPFGVGRIAFDPAPDALPEPLGVEGVGLSEINGRVFYPATDNPAFGKLVKGFLEGNAPLTSGGPVRRELGGVLRGILERPQRVTIYFLFRGADPLEISLQTREPIKLTAIPQRNPAAARRLMPLWWRQYAKSPGILQQKPDYPPMVETFLTATLARRLNLRLPAEKLTPSAHASLQKEIGLNLGTESLRMSMMRDRILGKSNLAGAADQPPPIAAAIAPQEIQEIAADVKVEPIAMHVPESCFYVRFGSFANFLWLQDTLAKWGGDAQNLIALRGMDRGMNVRMEKQLATKQTALSRMLGNTVIADVAIIGTDLFFREGASYGLLFHARNNFALSASLSQNRSELVSKGIAKEEKITLAGREVSFLSAPDGSVRSYYAADGDFHLLTTSKKVAEMFLATAGGKNSLGASREYRHARTIMPVDRDDTVWVYFSGAFFDNITSFPYRTEMSRRLQAAADIELVQLARLTAAAEGLPGETIEQLKSSGLLPRDFGPLPDGSRVVLDGDDAYDSLRGRRGAFVPVADVAVERASNAERTEYAAFSQYYSDNWGRMDPLMAGIKRTAVQENREKVVADVMMSPFAPQHFNTVKKWLGPADDSQLAVVEGDMAALDVVMNKQRIFAGMRDVGQPQNAGMGSFMPIGHLRDFVIGYVGTTGELGVLSFLNLGIPPGSDPAGYARSPLGGWRLQYDQFTIFSFQQDMLATVAPQLRFVKSDRPAQIRLRVDDVSRATITPRLNDLAYSRTRETSLGNIRLLHSLEQQLHVPAAKCREQAESLMDAKLLCPLGGEYVLRDKVPGLKVPGTSYWTSTALEAGLTGRAPEGYVSPPLSWFRGLNLNAMVSERNVNAHAEVLMQFPNAK